MGVDSGFFPLLRYVSRESFYPRIDVATRGLDLNSYPDLSNLDAVVFECMSPMYEAAAYATANLTVEQYAADVWQRTGHLATAGPQVAYVVLCFDFGRHPMKKPKPLPPIASTNRFVQALQDSTKRCQLVADVRNWIVCNAPLRLGLVVIMHGATGGPKPLALELSVTSSGTLQQQQQPPQKTLVRRLFDPMQLVSGRLPKPIHEWPRTCYEADDSVALWSAIFMYFGTAARPFNVLVHAKDSDIALKLLVQAELCEQLDPDGARKPPVNTRLWFCHERVMGHIYDAQEPTKRVMEPARNGSTHMMDIQQRGYEYMDVFHCVRTLQALFGTTLGIVINKLPALTLAMLVLCREHDYHAGHFIQGTPSLINLAVKLTRLAYQQNTPLADTVCITQQIPETRVPAWTSLLDPCTVEVNVDAFTQFVRLLDTQANPNDAQIRGQAARMALWLAKLLNNYMPDYVQPHECDQVEFTVHRYNELGMPIASSTRLLSRYGYEMVEQDDKQQQQNTGEPKQRISVCKPSVNVVPAVLSYIVPLPTEAVVSSATSAAAAAAAGTVALSPFSTPMRI